MPRGNRAKTPGVLDLVTLVEKVGGTVSEGTALELCKRLRAAELTIRAQREVIEAHARTIASLQERKQK